MNILFLSKLSGKKGCGPYYSIPRQVAAQRIYDNVMWLNMNNVKSEDWEKWADVKTQADYPDFTLEALPEPFNHPDVVFIEEQYNFFFQKIIIEIRKKKIPYIIVPRCSLTKDALNKKKIKKFIANQFFYKNFLKKALAIQYLTNNEREESGLKWNKNNIVIPNGINIPNIVKKFNKDKIECSFIGRIDIYHKGLDMLLEVCSKIKEKLEENNYFISIYGDGNKKDVQKLLYEIKSNGLEKNIEYKGPIYDKEKENVLKKTDIFILTSRFEGLPMGILEALSYGIPVLVTKGTNMADIIDEYEAGWSSDTTVDGIIKILTEAINSKKELKYKKEQCIKLAKIFSWEEIAKNTHEILLNLINKDKEKKGK